MNIVEFNNQLNENKIFDKIKNYVNKKLIKKTADAFFKSNPELLKKVKQIFSGNISEDIMLEMNVVKKGLLSVAIILAILSGIVTPAEASTAIQYQKANGLNTHYVTYLDDAIKNAENRDLKNYYGSYILCSDGAYRQINSEKDFYKIIEKADVKGYEHFIIISEKPIDNTGYVSKHAANYSQRLQNIIIDK